MWYNNGNVPDAIAAARTRQKPLLIDFWHPTCTGCAKLAATTYQEPAIIELLERDVIPVKYDTTRPNEWFKKLNGSHAHMWHPHIVVMDHHLISTRRIIGYLRPPEYIANVLVGVGILHLFAKNYHASLEAFDRVIDAPITAVRAEALYWAGVSSYRVRGWDGLVQRWNQLQTEHPTSDWTERADCLDAQIPEEGFDPDDPTSVRLSSHVAASANHL